MTPRWIGENALLMLHADSLARHGGSTGLRDASLLASALARPLNLHGYKPDADMAALAASYGYGIAKNHPLVDGNKRAALLAIGLFLRLNRLKLTASQADATSTMLCLASGEVSEEELANWLRGNIGS